MTPSSEMLQVVLYSPVLPVRSLIKVAAAVSMETTLVRISGFKIILNTVYCSKRKRLNIIINYFTVM